MFKFRLLSSIIAIFLFNSCEPVYNVTIKNNTSKDLILEVEFNKSTLEEYWNGKSYIEFLKSYPNNKKIYSFKFDSLALRTYYIIPPMNHFPLESGIGTEPKFDLFEKIRIIGEDTIVLQNRISIEAAFKKTGKRNWEFNIEEDN